MSFKKRKKKWIIQIKFDIYFAHFPAKKDNVLMNDKRKEREKKCEKEKEKFNSMPISPLLSLNTNNEGRWKSLR